MVLVVLLKSHADGRLHIKADIPLGVELSREGLEDISHTVRARPYEEMELRVHAAQIGRGLGPSLKSLCVQEAAALSIHGRIHTYVWICTLIGIYCMYLK